MELDVLNIADNIAPSLRSPQGCAQLVRAYPAWPDSEQDDQGENAKEHQRDQAGTQACHQLAAGVDVRGGVPFRRRRSGSRSQWMRRMRRHHTHLTCTIGFLTQRDLSQPLNVTLIIAPLVTARKSASTSRAAACPRGCGRGRKPPLGDEWPQDVDRKLRAATDFARLRSAC